MKHLSALNKYFWKYRYRLVIGILFVISSNYFAVLAPEITGYLVSRVQQTLSHTATAVKIGYHDVLVQWIIRQVEGLPGKSVSIVAIFCILILIMAVIRGVLMFFMRQTIIVMSRHIEYDQKNEIFCHYQQLDLNFFKTHATGDLMNRITEDVSRVRMYAGPAIMYLINLLALITFCVINMLRKDVHLTLLVLAPLPLLAIAIYLVNTIIHKKSEQVQARLSDLTTTAQESYSGIRVIKSFVQESAMLGFFRNNSESYRRGAVDLAKVEAIYFPSMSLMIGLSTLITILIGGQMALHDPTRVGIIVEFVIYINMLTFPVSSIGWVASMIQRASASQKRINEFLHIKPGIQGTKDAAVVSLKTSISFRNVSFTYPNTGIQALNNFSLDIRNGEKILILGKTGSGKSTIAQLLLRYYEAGSGLITIDNVPISKIKLDDLRRQVSYVPQDVFLFSDTVENNISFGLEMPAEMESIRQVAQLASVDKEIATLSKSYQTVIGERGITLSGGQKQRVSIARALIKDPSLIIFDDCLSAVDAKTEHEISRNLARSLNDRTSVFISHRILTAINFDNILFMANGAIAEHGTHQQLMHLNGLYAELYRLQNTRED
ncbi:MAG: transporter, transrane protein [Chitinophagaceae bacterium]|nr:transporter, transrane protein [Chitinophagaceae bacterium]